MQKRFLAVRTRRPLKPLKEKKIKGKRHYETSKGEIFPSVTTVLSLFNESWLKPWKDGMGKEVAVKVTKKHPDISSDIKDTIIDIAGEKATSMYSVNSMRVGTAAHKMIEDYLNNKPIDLITSGLFERSHFINVQQFVDKINNIRTQEGHLSSSKLRMAGRVDCVADYDGTKSIIDFKTGSKMKKEEDIMSYKLQVTAYAIMWNELQQDNIQQGVIIMSGADGGRGVFKINIADYVKPLDEAIQKYRLRYGDEKIVK